MSTRFASFNASLNRGSEGELINDLSTPDNGQAQSVAEVIQRTNPDVILINEFDFDAAGEAAQLFQDNYLSVSQNGAAPVDYPYVYVAPSNTGVPSGFDLDNSGGVGDFAPNDAFGFGFFEGQFAFAIFSKHPIVESEIRTFQEFLWKDMPGALLPLDPEDADGNGDTQNWYTPEELDVVRLSSKNHVDVPIEVDGEIIHVLASHPTPPVFDGPEDRNGTRNHDEIRFWADYVQGESYIYDDEGVFGGLEAGAKFVIMGDQNADPFDGDSVPGAAQQILENPLVNAAVTPSSAGGTDAAARQAGANETHLGDPAFDTADFGFAGVGNPDGAPGNLRVDYALPSNNLGIVDAQVFWQASDDPLFPLAEFPTSDHRLVYVDVEDTLPNGVASGDVTQESIVLWTRSTVLGQVTFEYSTAADFSEIEGSTTATVVDPLLPVKVAVEGLTPGTDYYYRVQDAAGSVEVGQFETAASLGDYAGLSFGVAGDWRGEIAPYPAITNVAEQALDFFVEHGDTIYADIPSPAVLNPDGTRKQQAETLEEFRLKHNEVYSERLGLNAWEDVRSSTSIFATIDDHEVTNDFSGGADASTDSRFPETTGFINDTALYENGLQTFQEYNPLRDEFYGETGDERTANERKLYRSDTFGSDAATFILDTRSFRDPELESPLGNPDPTAIPNFLVESLTSDRQFLGDVQLEDLKQDLLTAQQEGITWKFVMVPEPIQELGLFNADAFEGYAQERTEILQFIEENSIDNVVFVAADIHGTFVNNVTYQETVDDILTGTRIATDVWEITTGSVGFDPPAGQAIIGGAAALGLLTPEELAFYDSLPIAPDTDSFINDKDDFLASAFQTLAIGPAGFDPIGLENNLTAEQGVVGSFDVEATLLQGDYVAAHTYGWTQFDIDPETQQLTVTTYGIEPYSEADLLANPEAILNRTPEIVSQFVVNPQTRDTSLEFLGVAEIPSGTVFDETTIGGLSGIVFDPSTGNYLSVSDDRSAGDDGTPRFYELSIDLSDGRLDDGDVTFLEATALTLEDGVTTLDAINPDPEGIVISQSGDLLISSERDLNGNPAIYTFGQDGVLTGELAVDDKFLPDGSGTRGVRNNLGFESLTVSPSKEILYTATESALAQDGDRSTTTSSSTARIVEYDATTGEAVAEFVYEVDPIANEPDPVGAFADSGLVELLALDDQGTLLALERSFSIGAPDRGYTGKLYLVNTENATNIIDEESIPSDLDTSEYASKTLLADLGEDFNIVVDNIEGMTFGPTLPDGQQSLIIGSDDNFSAFGPQANQFIALTLNFESGTNGRDRLVGDDNSNILNGLGGDDRIVGNDGNDTLIGGAGADQLVGGEGDDTLRGGLGRDRLNGGIGSDVFVLAAGEGTDRIADFEQGIDFIGLTGSLSFEDLTFERKSVLFGDERLAIFSGAFDARTLTAADFTIV